MCIEVFHSDHTCVSKPYHVKINGVTLKNSKGEVKKFDTLLGALSKAQRIITQQERKKERKK